MAKDVDEKKEGVGKEMSHSERKQIISEIEGLSRAWGNVGSQATRELIEKKMATLLEQI